MKSVGRTKGYFRENNFKGGIHIVDSMHEVKEVADKMCGKHFIIPGRHELGLSCNNVLVSEFIEAKEIYFMQISYSRSKGKPVITYSDKGGFTYEALRRFYPESIKRIYIDMD